MGRGVIYYEYEKREKFEDYDLKADAELGTFKIRRYHFDNESFIHPLHSVRFDPDRPYEVPIEALMADQPLSSSDKGKTYARGSHHSRRLSPTPHYSLRMSSSTRRVVLPSPTVASSSLCRRVAVDADEDYLQYLEVLQHSLEYSFIHSRHASVPDLPKNSSVRHSVSHGTPSYDLSGVWPLSSSGPSI
ncbi:hypothetical protein PIB30_090075 [Stylosanthes scabra]|uniref:Uncharacterized protein n=1 Tax=Stylosanthes scabra TaxID=79078 RepID=A0ABU6XT81_9FABA|nr:hypothetical protein [Stylosanthes scabra]